MLHRLAARGLIAQTGTGMFRIPDLIRLAGQGRLDGLEPHLPAPGVSAAWGGSGRFAEIRRGNGTGPGR